MYILSCNWINDLTVLQLLKANGLSPRSSVSADDVTSDIGDPLHDESILQELFYKEVTY